jgi:UDP-N-acetylglucosamine:LPS N-acetylglucosamine transferase
MVVACGRNEGLHCWLEGIPFQTTCRALPFVEDMAQLVACADVIIGKAGALTIAEATVAGKPMIIYRPVPGQERVNTQFAVSQQLAQYSNNPLEVVEILRQMATSPWNQATLPSSISYWRDLWAGASDRLASILLEEECTKEGVQCRTQSPI